MNKIIVELHPEDRARLDAIIVKLDNLQPHCDDCVENVVTMVEAAHPASTPETAPVAPRPTAEPETAPVPTVEPPTLAEFQKAVAVRCAENPALKPKVRELVNKYAPSVSEIPTDKRIEFLDQLAAL